MSKVRWIGLDVHADTIAVAVAEPAGEVRPLGIIPNRPESIRKLVKKLGPAETLRACYEAGPTGYVVYWQLTALGVRCEVVAPTLNFWASSGRSASRWSANSGSGRHRSRRRGDTERERQSTAATMAAEGHTERRTLDPAMRPASGPHPRD
jgi:hypothetical protein